MIRCAHCGGPMHRHQRAPIRKIDGAEGGRYRCAWCKRTTTLRDGAPARNGRPMIYDRRMETHG